MEKVLNILEEMKLQAERQFINNSIIVHKSRTDNPIPDVKEDLEMIIELRKAISILDSSTMVKSVM